MRPSYLFNGNFYTGKSASLCWMGPSCLYYKLMTENSEKKFNTIPNMYPDGQIFVNSLKKISSLWSIKIPLATLF